MRVYARLGMLWSYIQVIIGSICVFVIPIPSVKPVFAVECRKDIIWIPHAFMGELFVTAHMLITMLYITMYYITFWTIPFRCNQVAKDSDEVGAL